MNIVLIGAVDSTRVALECLLDYGTPPSALLTLPLSRSSRHSDFVDLRPLAAEHDVKVIETANVNRPEVLAQLRELHPDYLMVIGWSQILREGFFALDAHLLGYHPALIPENRGRAVLPGRSCSGSAAPGRRYSGSTEGLIRVIFWCSASLPYAPTKPSLRSTPNSSSCSAS